MAAASTNLPDPSDQFTLNWMGGLISLSTSPNKTSSSDLSIYFITQEWRNSALCADETQPAPDFFPERGVPGETIRDFCFTCPVRLDCLEYSVVSMPKFGWFGGHPEEGRRAVRALMREGTSIEGADAIVLADALSKIRQRKKAEQGRRYDIHFGDEIAGEFELQPAI